MDDKRIGKFLRKLFSLLEVPYLSCRTNSIGIISVGISMEKK